MATAGSGRLLIVAPRRLYFSGNVGIMVVAVTIPLLFHSGNHHGSILRRECFRGMTAPAVLQLLAETLTMNEKFSDRERLLLVHISRQTVWNACEPCKQ